MSPALHSADAGATDNPVSPRSHTRSEGCGCRTVRFSAWCGACTDAGLVINTVPARVIGEAELAVFRKDMLVIDLASKPGGDVFGDRKAQFMKEKMWKSGLTGGALLLTAAAVLLLQSRRNGAEQTVYYNNIINNKTNSDASGTAEQTAAQTTANRPVLSTKPADNQYAETDGSITNTTATPDRSLNTADEAALRRVSGVGDILAAAIVQYRTETGGFTRREQLLEIDGIGEALAARIMEEFYIPDELPPSEPEQQESAAEPEPPQETVPPGDAPEQTAYFDVNTVTRAELLRIPQMTETCADEILALREQLGGFSSIYELSLAEHVSAEYLADVLREHLYAEGEPAQPIRDSAAE